MSKYDNYELIFMHNGRVIKFNSRSLREIKDVNQILINISYDIKRLERGRRYKVNGRYYNLRYNNGVIKILDSYDKRQNRYFMTDDLGINVVDKEKLNSKLIFEDSDDYLGRNEASEVVLNSKQYPDNFSRMSEPYESRRPLEKELIEPEGIDKLNDEPRFYSRDEVVDTEDELRYSKENLDESLIVPESDSQKHDIENYYIYDNERKLESPRYDAKPRRYSEDYPQNITRTAEKTNTVFTSSIDDDPETRDKVIKLSSYVDASSHRSLVLNDINTSIKTPKTISTETGLRPNYVSKVLRDFKDKGLVVCINEEARKGKLYELTPLGMKIFNYLRGAKSFF